MADFGLLLKGGKTPGRAGKVLVIPHSVGGIYPSDATIVTDHDTVTNFAVNANILSIQTGDWSDATTWNLNRIPTTGDIVGIKTTHIVTYDVDSTDEILAVGVAGTLTFRTDIDTKLVVQNLLVYGPPTLGDGDYAYLEIGTSSSPVDADKTAEVVFPDTALLDPNTGPTTNAEYSNGLLVWGKLRICGAAKTDFVECTANLLATATTINFQSAVSGWLVGDRIVIPDTRQWVVEITAANFDHIEVPTISTIAVDGLSLTVPALSFAHPRAVDKDGNQDFAPEIANLTRNVIFRSENVNGVHGHCICLERCDVDVRYARFDSLGRTKNATLPNTTTNQKGRYSWHNHHIFGPGNGTLGAGGVGYDASVDAPEFSPGNPANIRSCNGPVFRLIGCVLEDQTTVTPDAKWPITTHGTADGLIQSNVVYRGTGSLAMQEDGTEVYNVVKRNFLVHCYAGTNDRGDASYFDGAPGREGNGFSCPNGHNYYRDNRVYNIGAGVGFPSNATAYHYYGGQNTTVTGAVGGQEDNFNLQIASWQGADPDVDFDQNYNYPILDFSDNECACCEVGWTVWFLGTSYTTRGPEEIATSTLLRYNVWNVRVATFNYPSANLYFSEGKWRGDFGSAVMGLSVTDYQTRGEILDGVDIQGFTLGVNIPEMVGVHVFGEPYDSEGVTIFRNMIFANTKNVTIRTMAHVGAGENLVPRRTEITNCMFYHPAGWTDDFDQTYYPDPDNPGGQNWVDNDRVFFYDFNAVAEDDFQVFWPQQASTFLTPQSDPTGQTCVGSPLSGMTNEFNLIHVVQPPSSVAPLASMVPSGGICFAGALWDRTDVRTGFDGYYMVLPGVNAPVNGEPDPMADMFTLVDLEGP